MMTSNSATGTLLNLGGRPSSLNKASPCCRGVMAGPGPPMGKMRLNLSGSVRQLAMKSAKSSSLMGLQAVA